MRYEVIESTGEWIVRRDGVELARFPRESDAMKDVRARLRAADPEAAAQLTVRYQGRG